MDLVEYLQSKGVDVKLGGTGQVHSACFFCDEDPSRPGRLYFNNDPDSDKWGLFKCFLCDTKGSVNTLRKHFGDPPLDNKPSYKVLHILNAATDYYVNQLLENPDAYTYLRIERGLSDQTIEKLRFGWADGGVLKHLMDKGFSPEEVKDTGLVNLHGFDFFQAKITIPYIEWGNTTTIRGKELGGKYLSLPGSRAQLYGVDAVRGEETVVLTAGEFDCALLQQLGFAAVGVPGENIWKPEWTETLDEARRIYVVFDNDAAGRAGSEKVAKELGPRSRVVEMPKASAGQKKIDVTEWVVNHNKTRESFEWLFSKAKGGLLVSVAEAFDRWLEVEGNPNRVGLRFNIEELDTELNHGLTPGQVVVLVGKTNCLAADTEIIVNRGGVGRHYTLEYVFNMLKGDGVVGVNGRKYTWSEDNTIMVQRRWHDGTVRLVELKDIWYSGEKELWEVTTACGKKIKSTTDHRFMTENGFRPLKDIFVGDCVYVNQGKGLGLPKKEAGHYKQKSGLTHHPYRTRRKIYPLRDTPGNTVQLHRVVYEAYLNDMTFDDFVQACQTGDIDGLTFINPKTHTVHHLDEDKANNSISNLELLDRVEHLRHHATDGPPPFLYQTGLTEVVDIEYVGMGDTYDIEVLDDPHNFIANEFVVHNSAKSLSTFNILHRMKLLNPGIRILLLSLEQTKNEWYERAHRIHNFYEPGASTIETVRFWEQNLYLVDKNRVTEAELEVAIDQYRYETRHSPDIVVVDYLGYYARSFHGEEYQRTSTAIMGLKAIAKEHECVFFVPHQANRQVGFAEQLRLDSMRGSGVVEETADMVLSIFSTDQSPGIDKADEKKEIHMTILKSRDGGVNAKVIYQFAPLTLALVPRSDPLQERALLEKKMAWAGLSWQEAAEMHRTGSTTIQGNALTQEASGD